MTPTVTVVGLGPAGPEHLTGRAASLLSTVRPAFLRTRRHPAAAALADGALAEGVLPDGVLAEGAALAEGVLAFDDVYDAAESLDEVYRTIVDRLVAAALEHGRVLYAVPGSPDVAERTVALLRADERVAVEVEPGLSFLDLVWDRLGLDPLAAGVRLVDGQRFAVEAAGERGPLLVAQCDSRFVLSDIKLAADPPDDATVTVLQRLGSDDERVFEVAWADLDRVIEPDHLTSVYVPRLAAPIAAEVARFAELVATLRRECPWDREQTHQSLTRHLTEETYEVLEAIESLDPDTGEGFEHLEEELGDLLFQVVFHATLAAEDGRFTLADVASGIHDKLHARHPHVFGDVEVADTDDVRRNWERIKKAEKGRTSVLEGIPAGLPALLTSLKVQRKAANHGMDFPSVASVLDKIAEELDEVTVDPGERELGDLLFAVTALAMHLDVDPESALRVATGRFADRFRTVEALADERGLDLLTADQPTLDVLWDEAKAQVPDHPEGA